MQMTPETINDTQANLNFDAQSRFGNLMSTIGESSIGKRAVAGVLVASSAFGGIAATETSAVAAVEEGQDTARTSVLQGDGTESKSATSVLLPANDMYNVYAGIRGVSFSPQINDTPNPNDDPIAAEAVEICGISTPDAGITIVEDPYNNKVVQVTVASTVTGEHHNTITFCNPAEGTSASSDFGLNVTAVHNIVVKKLQRMRRGLHLVKLTNNNDLPMVFNGSYSTTTVPPHKSRKQPVPRVSKYTSFLQEQFVLTGKGRIKFPR